MKISLEKGALENPLIDELERISGETLRRCYQCGKCSAGCPVSFAMDMAPAQVMRFLQLGRLDDVMRANSMWLCVGCLQCQSRCPQSVSVAAVLEGMRQMTLRKGEDHEKVREIPVTFLKAAPQQAIVSGFRKFVS